MKPRYYDNVNFEHERRWDYKKKCHKFNTQDPLHLDYRLAYITGGIQPYVERLRHMGFPEIPVPKRAYVIYHMAKSGVYDPEALTGLEKNLSLSHGRTVDIPGESNLQPRACFGAVAGYWKLNYGSAEALKYWEYQLLKYSKDLHV